MTIEEYELTFKREGTLQYQYFQVLKDCQWHCRTCDASGIDSGQLAGGGGVQGLQRGTKSRPGLNIISEIRFCDKCKTNIMHDRWDGTFKEATSASGIPEELQVRILSHYNYTDSIEQRQRQAHELIIDHRKPMNRWGTTEDANPVTMTENEIQAKFQLLKKDSSGNHNLLKSRACERCKASGKRGYPLGINFYYEGTEDWPSSCPIEGDGAEQGCIGCGWYDFDKWRTALNLKLNSIK